MKTLKIILLWVTFSVLGLSANAQKTPPSFKVSFGKGIAFASADSSFTMQINGRVQSMAEFKYELADQSFKGDFLLRRCRLNIAGNAFHPRFSYRIQLGFAHGDITANNSTENNNLLLRDAMLFYQPVKWLKLGFGQTKLPGNRQRQVSSANLQLVERSIVNNNFTLDRDKGLWLYGSFKAVKGLIKPSFAISSGDGRIISNRNGKMCYSGRLEWQPMGEFGQSGDYIEACTHREESPRLSVAAAASFNDDSPRTLGQLGDYLYNGETSDILYYGGDLMFKYKGFSLESELYRRQSDKGVIVNTGNNNLGNGVLSGTGFFVQSGVFLTKKTELAARFSAIWPDSKVAVIHKEQQEYVLGATHYFMKHNLKFQADCTFLRNGSAETFIFRLNGVVSF